MAAEPRDTPWSERAELVVETGSYEDVRDLLEEVVARLEVGNLTLNDGLEVYEIGVRLSSRAEQILAMAEIRISQLQIGGDDDDSKTGQSDLDDSWDHDEATGETAF